MELRAQLRAHSRDLVGQALKLDPVIGRSEEIENLIIILSRPNKNCPLLTGSPGVGKTAVVEGFAQRIAKGHVPSNFVDVSVLELDIGELMATTKSIGEFKETLNNIMKEIEKDVRAKVILFIDDIQILGARTIAMLFKAILARRRLRCIGAMTFAEYQMFTAKQYTLFERKFEQVYVAEPSVQDTINILEGLKERYEIYHGVRILNPALVAAAQLSARYITRRHLPGKAIRLVDETCANIRVQLASQPKEIDSLQRREKEMIDEIQRLEQDHEKQLISLQNGERSCVTVPLYGGKQKINNSIAGAEGEAVAESVVLPTVVGLDQIAEVVSHSTRIPVTRLIRSKKKSLVSLAERLHDRVVGQNQAVDVVAKAILRLGTRLGNPQQPVGSFLFLGPIGVGKTQLAKALAEQLFNDENLIVSIDMSNYMDLPSVADFIDTLIGYVGYEECGQLAETVQRMPCNVVLFAKVEIAHPSVLDTLLKLLDGTLTDVRGRTVDISNTVIIMTSNLGAEHLSVGIMSESAVKIAREQVMEEEVRRHFRPELLNWLDEIIIFDPLSHEQRRKVIRLHMKNVALCLARKGATLTVTDAAIDVILSEPCDPKLLEKRVVTDLSRMLIRDEIYENSIVHIDAVLGEKELVFKVEKNGEMLNAWVGV